MAVERTFVMIKPGGVERGLVGEVVRRFEARGYTIKAAKFLKVPTALAKEHYAEHKARPFFGELIEGITAGPVAAFVFEGESVVKVARTMIGATNPVDAAPGTIRGDLATEMGENVVHGSDSIKSAKREIKLWFSGKGEVVK